MVVQTAAQQLQQAQLTLDAVLYNATVDPAVLAASLTAAAATLSVQPFSNSTVTALQAVQVSQRSSQQPMSEHKIFLNENHGIWLIWSHCNFTLRRCTEMVRRHLPLRPFDDHFCSDAHVEIAGHPACVAMTLGFHHE